MNKSLMKEGLSHINSSIKDSFLEAFQNGNVEDVEVYYSKSPREIDLNLAKIGLSTISLTKDDLDYVIKEVFRDFSGSFLRLLDVNKNLEGELESSIGDLASLNSAMNQYDLPNKFKERTLKTCISAYNSARNKIGKDEKDVKEVLKEVFEYNNVEEVNNDVVFKENQSQGKDVFVDGAALLKDKKSNLNREDKASAKPDLVKKFNKSSDLISN